MFDIFSVRKVHLTYKLTGGIDILSQTAQFYNECKSTDPSLRLNIVDFCKVHLTHTHTHTDGTDIWPQTAQFYNECI